MEKEILVDKMKIIRNPTRKDSRTLLKDLKELGHETIIQNRGGIEIKIIKRNVERSLPTSYYTSKTLKN